MPSLYSPLATLSCWVIRLAKERGFNNDDCVAIGNLLHGLDEARLRESFATGATHLFILDVRPSLQSPDSTFSDAETVIRLDLRQLLGRVLDRIERLRQPETASASTVMEDAH